MGAKLLDLIMRVRCRQMGDEGLWPIDGTPLGLPHSSPYLKRAIAVGRGGIRNSRSNGNAI